MSTTATGRRDELEKLYEREKRWEELAAVLDKQAMLSDDPAKRGVILPKLATVYTEKLRKPTWRWPRGRRCWMRSPRTDARRMRFASCICRTRIGTARRFYSVQASGTIRAGAGAAGRNGNGRGAGRAVEQDRGSLP